MSDFDSESKTNTNIQSLRAGKQVAVVTGGSRGIGAAIAEKLGSLGFHVVVNYVANEIKALEVVKKIESAGGKATAIRFDVSNETEVSEGFEKIAALGTLAVLVNNAGISEDGLILRLKASTLEKTIQTNLISAILCAKEATKLMMKARHGSIIQISSVVGEMGNAGQVAYSAAKAGMIGFTKSLAKEVASRKIRVNAVTPGYIETDMTHALNDAQRSAITEKIPLGILGSPQDVAEMVGFLASDGSKYVTGQVLGVNGGLYI
jgi:3-oxoacyl-[acyl-carrier protein] reductase